MKSIKNKNLLTLISVIVLSCNVESISAQTARISASAVFANGETKTFATFNTVTNNFDTAGNLISNTITPTSVLTSSVSGPITTISAESSLPSGFYYSGTTVVLPTYTTLTSGEKVLESLSLGGGAITAAGPANSFTQAAASILLQAASGNPSALTSRQLEAAAALIKAGAGINGLE
ncbi:hypothetical protein H6F42_12275 [Pseudanabaena sp. FACHB-1998]|uniref:hypothetical protein n=1 Tax=Pseudanabaena sp. FACHB-1998 TaxID=2692858 RepID=UPI001680BD74|nr:hypothetical protein [Pseudanabaena sp. FACHB-1998]MBD2177691.1 hypothetical protein [Pseudanabaena sp. FACHB-1998]